MKRQAPKKLSLQRLTVTALAQTSGALRYVDSYGDGCSNSCNTCRYTDCCVDVPDEATLVWLTSSACPPGMTDYCVA